MVWVNLALYIGLAWTVICGLITATFLCRWLHTVLREPLRARSPAGGANRMGKHVVVPVRGQADVLQFVNVTRCKRGIRCDVKGARLRRAVPLSSGAYSWYRDFN